MQDSITQLVELLLDIIDERAAEMVESRLPTVVEEVVEAALSSVEGFDIHDYENEIEDMIDKKVREMSFSVTVD
jgi:hypothetical protein